MDLANFVGNDGSQVRANSSTTIINNFTIGFLITQASMRNLQYMLQSYIRLAFLEGKLTVYENTDGTVLVTLEDEKSGEKPLTRIVNYERRPANQPSIGSAITNNAITDGPEVEDNVAAAISRAISRLNIHWEQKFNVLSTENEDNSVVISHAATSLNKCPSKTLTPLEVAVNQAKVEENEAKVEVNQEAVETMQDFKAVEQTNELETKTVAQPKPRKFCYKKDGDSCSACDVIKCPNCPFLHEKGRCFATGKECNGCKEIGHYIQKCPERRNREWNRK